MIKATVKATGWAADKPKETVIQIDENETAFEQTNINGTKTPVTFGKLFQVYKERKTYVKTDAGYETSNINPEQFELWFFRKYVPKVIYDRLISVHYELV
jgi:hypothetical protein